uniref:LOW QUALITY PROTEIN: TBC1 domain family member 19-like n=1 Tax=Saccoglossus kowalevskii TaxID=10224 RepID=A0ABM0M3X5_SACKO|nr:PREDICTED: LOW QUALITY PROTEIN: TBC1 domain family member 19-like [Saccoglossus kowalevskii]
MSALQGQGDQSEHLSVLIAHIVQELRGTVLHSQLKRAAQFQAGKPNIHLSDLKKEVHSALVETGWERKLRNAVYKHMVLYPQMNHPSSSGEHCKEPLSYIRKSQSNWEKRILKSLNSMCTELSVPLARKRPLQEQKELKMKWNELGTDEPDLSAFRPVYAPKDFLDVLMTLKNPNCNSSHENKSMVHTWGLIQMPFKIKTMKELRDQYWELTMTESQTGVDDLSEIAADVYETERTKLGKKVLQAGHSPLAQQFSKEGCPATQRCDLWAQILGVTSDDIDKLYYEQLKSYVFQHDLLVDSLIYKDIKLTATNDDNYFVFEDYLYQALLVFSRDTHVLKHFANSSATPAKSYIRGKLGMEEYAVVYPPNGVIPFHGFSMFVSPLCYVYHDPVRLYFIFRELYMRYFFRLHNISSHPQGIVALSILFESLLQTHQPQLFYHLREIGAQPLRIAFKWIMRAFSGFLASDQLLLLWDRILAYNSLEILPVLAMAIFAFRRVNLMEVTTFSAADAVMADLTGLKLVPLLQVAIFSSQR